MSTFRGLGEVIAPGPSSIRELFCRGYADRAIELHCRRIDARGRPIASSSDKDNPWSGRVHYRRELRHQSFIIRGLVKRRSKARGRYGAHVRDLAEVACPRTLASPS